MPKDQSKVNTSTDVPLKTGADGPVERRRRLSHLIGRILARNWLRKRHQNADDEPLGGDSQGNGSV